MALVALGVTGGIGAYKAVEVARLLQKRGHDVRAVMTRSARRFVGPLTFEAITRHPVITSQFTPGMNADIEHIALASEAKVLLVAPGDGQRDREVRERHRRRLSVGARSGDEGAGAPRAGDEHQHVGSPGGAGEPRDARRARRPLRRARRGLSRVRLDRQGPARRAGGHRRRRRAAARAAPDAVGAARARHGRPDDRRSRSGAVHRQPIERPHGLCDRRRGAGARRGGHARRRPDRRSRRPRWTISCACAAPPRCTPRS